jgi:hypothetical protein
MSALLEIRQCGFQVEFKDGFIEVKPPSKLTDDQRKFIAANKSEIILELKAELDGKKIVTPKPIKNWQLSLIKKWLAHIGETDQELIDDVLEQCQADPEALAYFLKRHAEIVKPSQPNNRRRVKCGDCRNWQPHDSHGKGSGACGANVRPNGVTHWHDDLIDCGRFEELL